MRLHFLSVLMYMLLSDHLCFMRCWKRPPKFCMVDDSFRVSILLVLFGVNILMMLEICLVAYLFGGFLWEIQLAVRGFLQTSFRCP